MMGDGEGSVSVVGTAHVSERSADRVADVILSEKPDVVALELDARRYQSLVELDGEGENGLDMWAAMRAAEEIGVPVALIDRDLLVTVRRVWSETGLVEKFKGFGALVVGALGVGGYVDPEEILENDEVLGLIEDMREFLPNATDVLIDERDRYMASRLRHLSSGGFDVVAVVGAGHKRGIEECLESGDFELDVFDDVSMRVGMGYDVLFDGEEIKVEMDLPGSESELISVEVRGRYLEVRAEVFKPVLRGYHYVFEGREEVVELEVYLPVGVDEEGGTATYEDGVLEVVLPLG